jgi:hypothetical protein
MPAELNFIEFLFLSRRAAFFIRPNAFFIDKHLLFIDQSLIFAACAEKKRP